MRRVDYTLRSSLLEAHLHAPAERFAAMAQFRSPLLAEDLVCTVFTYWVFYSAFLDTIDVTVVGCQHVSVLPQHTDTCSSSHLACNTHVSSAVILGLTKVLTFVQLTGLLLYAITFAYVCCVHQSSLLHLRHCTKAQVMLCHGRKILQLLGSAECYMSFFYS